VQCIAPDQVSACAGTTPVCDSTDACRGCTAHSECSASSTCLPDGSCADEATVAYVSATGAGATCTRASPCALLKEALATNRPYVKIAASGAAKDTATTVIDGKVVTILAETGAMLDRDGDGPILEVRSAGATVAIYDLQISGASGGDGITVVPNGGAPTLSLTRVVLTNNQGAGLSSSGGTVTIAQSTISGNTGGGVSLTSSQFDLTNNVIVKNGSPSSTFGGVLVTQVSSGTRRIEFNTIGQNGGTAGTSTGVVCALVTQAITFSSNIVYGNTVSAGGKQVDGSNCSWTYSDIGPDTAAGTGNINADPMFVNPTTNDFHLGPSSPCRDVANPAATLAVDIDGDARPQGSGRDIGADEHRP
jgi:hypothetical protein